MSSQCRAYFNPDRVDAEMSVTRDAIDTAVMFADVAGSSKLYKQVGDFEANRTISSCVATMSATVQAYTGIVVKTIGDEVMARFATSDQACAAAIDIQRNSTTPGGLPIRIGMAHGSAILAGGDIFGEVVNDAAAVAKIARAHQILVTDLLANDLQSEGNVVCQPYDKITLKGGRQESGVLRVVWETQKSTANATRMVNFGSISKTASTVTIVLSYDGMEICVAPDDTPFVVGRDVTLCNLVVSSNFASRDHFHIVHRRGKFVLQDHSTNGTNVKIEGAAPIYLRREDLPLRGNGLISMAQSPDDHGHESENDAPRLSPGDTNVTYNPESRDIYIGFEIRAT
jgi:class 3 adenylate cyclase